MMLSLVVIVLLVVVQAQDSKLIHAKCDDTGTCYSLHGDRPVSWSYAKQHCTNIGHELLSIENSQKWENVKSFMKDVQTQLDDEHDVWTSGRRSDNNNWISLIIKYTENLDGRYPSDKYCAYIDNDIVRSDKCYAKRHAICKIGSDITYYNQSVTWFEARNYCKQQGGELADEVPMQQSDYWIGNERRPWMWNSTNGHITWYAFSDDEGSFRDQACLYLKYNDRLLEWRDKSCEENANYFICQRKKDVQDENGFIATSVSGSINPSSVSPSQNPHKSNDDGGQGEDRITVPVAVSMSILGAAVVSGVIAFLLIRRRRRMLQKNNNNGPKTATANDDPTTSSYNAKHKRISHPIPLDSPAFRVSAHSKLGPLISVGPYVNVNSVDNTYAEITDHTSHGANGNAPGFTPRHVVHPSGDVYSLPQKPDTDHILVENEMYHSNVR